MTRILRHALVLAALVVAVALPPAVNAATAADCQVAVDDLGTATAAATFVGKNAAKEETGLVGKLDGASDALAAGKLADTVKKLTDFQSHAVTIGGAGKLDSTDAGTLAQLADHAIACVGSIGA